MSWRQKFNTNYGKRERRENKLEQPRQLNNMTVIPVTSLLLQLLLGWEALHYHHTPSPDHNYHRRDRERGYLFTLQIRSVNQDQSVQISRTHKPFVWLQDLRHSIGNTSKTVQVVSHEISVVTHGHQMAGESGKPGRSGPGQHGQYWGQDHEGITALDRTCNPYGQLLYRVLVQGQRNKGHPRKWYTRIVSKKAWNTVAFLQESWTTLPRTERACAISSKGLISTLKEG